MSPANRNKLVYVIIAVLVLAAAVFIWQLPLRGEADEVPAENEPESNPGGLLPEAENDSQPPVVEIVHEGLVVPWEIIFLPGGDRLITERTGSLRRLGETEQEFMVEGVEAVGEGGLLGLALHPDFSDNGWLYVYFTTRTSDRRLVNRIVRYSYDGYELSGRQVILDNIPAGGNHDGGRLAFGPDGNLYATTGDAGQANLAQDRNSLAGKILRLATDGSVPYGNPFDNLTWSYGHRNPQGLAWDDEGRLWSVEHGRSGLQSGLDELNLIEAGKNYGWPMIEGDESREGLESPVAHSGTRTTWAPAGLIFLDGQLLFTGLRGNAVYRSEINTGGANAPQAYWQDEYGRLRAIKVGPDGNVYIGTSNRDGRGQVQDGDDKIIRVSPEVFEVVD